MPGASSVSRFVPIILARRIAVARRFNVIGCSGQGKINPDRIVELGNKPAGLIFSGNEIVQVKDINTYF